VSTKAQASRIEHVDVLRGLAVIFMILLHTADGWLLPELKLGASWQLIRVFGGLAAPLFLALAGLSLGLKWGPRTMAERHAGLWADAGRGLSIWVLGYLMRVQMWFVDGGGYKQLTAWIGALGLLLAYGLAYRTFTKLGQPGTSWPSFGRTLMFSVVLATATLLWLAPRVPPTRLAGLLRVDVLQAIGMSLALLCLWARAPLSHRALGALLLGTGLAIALASGTTHAWLPGSLPPALAAYLGNWETPAGQPRIAMFPLLPWFAYASVGAALGLYWGALRKRGTPILRSVVTLTAAGAALALVSYESSAHVQSWLKAAPDIVQLVRVLYRVGVSCVLAGAAYALAISPFASSPPVRALVTLGRESMLVYWVHLEFCFGAAGTALRHLSTYPEWAFGFGALVLAMLAVATVRQSLRRSTVHAVIKWPASPPGAVGHREP
jgi:uncharacterized membrane protein